MSDRGRDVSDALAEVRTVLSRSETAMDTLLWNSYRQNLPAFGWVWNDLLDYSKGGQYKDLGHLQEPGDPDAEEMWYALEATVQSLARWRKAGKTKR